MRNNEENLEFNLKWFYIFLGIIALISLIVFITFGFEHVPNSSGTGPRDGNWHITSGGKKSYYVPKTDDWGERRISSTESMSSVVFALVMVIILLGVFVSKNFFGDEDSEKIKYEESLDIRNNEKTKIKSSESSSYDAINLNNSLRNKNEIIGNNVKQYPIKRSVFIPATAKQKAFMNRLKIAHNEKTTKKEAIKLISSKLESRRFN